MQGHLSEKEPWEMTREEFERTATVFHGTGLAEAKVIEETGFVLPKDGRAVDVPGVYLGSRDLAEAYSIQIGAPIWRERRAFRLIPAEVRREGKVIPVYIKPEAKIGDAEKLTRISDAKAQMDYYRERGFDIMRRGDELIVINPDAIMTHKQVIQQALSEGKPVPSEVLAGYPELAANHIDQPYLEKYRKLASKYPSRIDDHLERAKGEKASIILGRDFGEDLDSFLDRRPDVKKRWNELTIAIKELEQVKAGITPEFMKTKGHLSA